MLTKVAQSSRHAVARLPYRLLQTAVVPIPSLAIQCLGSASYQRNLSTSTPLARRFLISEGRTTTPKADQESSLEPSSKARPTSPFYLETGYSIFAKRPSRPFPPPFVSLPSGSFSDPLTTHNPSSNSKNVRRPTVNGQPVRGITNGDDAIIIGGGQRFIAVNDGVGAWAQKERGHAALWSRLIAHFWDVEIEKSLLQNEEVKVEDLNPVKALDVAFEATKKAAKGTLKREPENEVYSEAEEGENDDSSSPGGTPSASKDSENTKDSSKNDILGTTTASSALLYHNHTSPDPTPVILATTVGDCKVLIVRPFSASQRKAQLERDSETSGGIITYRSTEQYHWFDCPRQLGTNSPDTPTGHAVCDTIENVEVGDVVAVLSDGVTDNLWEHEICESICESLVLWQGSATPQDEESIRTRSNRDDGDPKDGVIYIARRLMNAAREIAMDPNAESPYMEKALDEGLAAEGGKLDDISVVVGIVRKRE